MTSITQRTVGQMPDGADITEFKLQAGGLSLSAITLGGIVTQLLVPDRHGVPGNVVLGFDNISDYIHRNPNFGTTVGRYGNRIANASFELDGQLHALTANDGPNCLHGGARGFSKRLWQAQPGQAAADGSISLLLNYTSAAGEEGFPGELQVQVRYTLTAQQEWRIDYEARTNAPTVVNLTHHDYFNLAGSGTALNHELQLHASRFLAVNEHLIPNAICDVAQTPFDFRQPTVIESRLRDPHPQLGPGKGYDHCWLIDAAFDGSLRHAATLSDASSGRRMRVLTTEPAVQFYTGNFLDGRLIGPHGQRYRAGDGVCLETQHNPDSPHHSAAEPDWPTTVLRPGETFRSSTVHGFGVA